LDGEGRNASLIDIGVDQYQDTLGDGIPDWWKLLNGWDGMDPTWISQVDSFGQTNLQKYQSAVDQSAVASQSGN